MILNGISIKGSYHEINQDAYIYKKLGKSGFIIAVSDGLGSKLYSHIGSKTLCWTAYNIVRKLKFNKKLMNIKPLELTKIIHKKWIEKLSRKGLDIKQCSATMLVLVVLNKRIIAIRLGDGFISISYDDSIKVLFDKKEDNFANETYCLSSNLYVDEIEFFDIKFKKFFGAILSTDGLILKDNVYEEFTQDFLNDYKSKTRKKAKDEIYNWLKDWTGADDKTISYCIYQR